MSSLSNVMNFPFLGEYILTFHESSHKIRHKERMEKVLEELEIYDDHLDTFNMYVRQQAEHDGEEFQKMLTIKPWPYV